MSWTEDFWVIKSVMISSSSLIVLIWIALTLSFPLTGSSFLVSAIQGSLCFMKVSASSLMSQMNILTLSSAIDQQIIEDTICTGSRAITARLLTIECKAGALGKEG